MKVMPVRQVGKDCYQWGNQKLYCGTDAKRKAILQGIAIENTGWKEAEEADEEDWWVVSKHIHYTKHGMRGSSKSAPIETLAVATSERAKPYHDYLMGKYKGITFDEIYEPNRNFAEKQFKQMKWDEDADSNYVALRLDVGKKADKYLEGERWGHELTGLFPSHQRTETVKFTRIPASKILRAEEAKKNWPIFFFTGVAFALSLPYFLDSRGNKV